MFANRSRKRASSDAQDDLVQKHGPRRSLRLRLRIAGNVQRGAPPQSSQPLHPPPPSSPSAAPLKRSRGLETANSSIEDGQLVISSLSRDDEKEPFTFFSFPGELRNMIYNYSLHYPDSRQLYAPYYRRPSTHRATSTSTSKWEPHLRAPTILLLNKRITNECLPILKSTKLVINRLPPPITSDIHNPYLEDNLGCPQPSLFMRLSDFISPRTLQNIPEIDINVGLCEGPLGSGWAWKPVVYELLKILSQRNKCSKLRLVIRLCNIHDQIHIWRSDRGYHDCMLKRLEKFANMNPNIFMRPEIKTEMWKIKGQKATYVEGGIVGFKSADDLISATVAPSSDDELSSDEDTSTGEVTVPETKPSMPPRMYPDKEMFPGSVMEFVKPAPPPLYPRDEWD